MLVVIAVQGFVLYIGKKQNKTKQNLPFRKYRRTSYREKEQVATALLLYLYRSHKTKTRAFPRDTDHIIFVPGHVFDFFHCTSGVMGSITVSKHR